MRRSYPLFVSVVAVGAGLLVLPILAAQRAEHLAHDEDPGPDPAGLMMAPAAEAAGASSFLYTFDGAPASPRPFSSPDWDVTANVSDTYLGDGVSMDPMNAQHGADCSPPPATHRITRVDQAVYQCKDHVMTAMDSGYGAVYLTPDRLVDFSRGAATVSFDVSTARTTGRDWIDLWITPYEDNLQIPLDDWLPPYQGPPRRAVHIKMDGGADGGTVFKYEVFNNFQSGGLGSDDWRSYEQVLTPSAMVRTTFQLTISRTHLKFGMPAYGIWWADSNIPDLGWGQGVVQLAQHAYNPTKDCTPGTGNCVPNTWHWDNVAISPAVTFGMLHGDQRFVTAKTSTRTVRFGGAAPANASLRFIAVGGSIRLSYDGGKTWATARRQAQAQNKPEHFSSYWTPIPRGVTSVTFDGTNNSFGAPWMARDFAIWSPTASAGGGGTSTPTPQPTSTPRPTNTPAPTATGTRPPTSTPPPSTGTVTFDDLAGQDRALTGRDPGGVADWGTGRWYLSSPWGKFTTKSISFAAKGATAVPFNFMTPRRLVSIQAYNGGAAATTVSLTCTSDRSLPPKQQAVAAGALATVSTGWAKTCKTVVVGSSNGWDTNFDNLVYAAR